MYNVVVIGGGASGMIAAYFASCRGKKVALIEKNEKLGKKLYITGKGRCNLTNSLPVSEFLNNVVVNSKFLYGALNAFSPYDVMNFFEEKGCKLKTERGNRVFPESDKASDITKTLNSALNKKGVDIMLSTLVKGIEISCGKVLGVKTDRGLINCESVIVCTGGASYPLTGSTGDGYGFAKQAGHSVEPLNPSLVGIELKGETYKPLQGLSLKNVSATFFADGKEVYSDFGEMLFTHYGVSGPIMLSASCIINRVKAGKIVLKIDLKPALDEKTLNDRLIREFTAFRLKNVANAMRSVLPESLINPVLSAAQVRQDKRCCDVLKVERENIARVLKDFRFEVKGLRPISEAIVTAGGISVKEINPKSMESKLVKGLYFAGEVLDVDAFTGGFNIQIAFSTGYVAGNNA